MRGDSSSERGLRRLEDWWGSYLSRAAGLYIVEGLGLYAGRSAQKIISRARCNPLARTCQSPRTKLVCRLARFVLQVARISHPLHEDPNSSWGGFPTLPRTKPKVGGFYRRFLHYLEVVSRRYSLLSVFGIISGFSGRTFRLDPHISTKYIDYIF